MRKIFVFNPSLSLFLIALLCTPALAELDELEPYDDFSAKYVDDCKSCIDTDKWSGENGGNSRLEIERIIKGKRAVMSVRNWGEGDVDAGRKRGNVGLTVNDDPVSITGFCFTPRVKKYELAECETNPNVGFLGGGHVLMRYKGNYYDTGDYGDNFEGTLSVIVNFIHSNADDEEGSLKASEFRAFVDMYECQGEDCLSPQVWRETFELGTFKKSNKDEFCVAYDDDENEFIITAGDVTRTVTAADDGLPVKENDMHPNRAQHIVEVRSDVENCSTGMLSQYIEADFDNVSIRRASEPEPLDP